jgi:tryptophan-rich sensory protein
MTRSWTVPLVLAGLAALAVAMLGMTITDLGPWYRSLRQPEWAPPDPVYGAAWTLIYALAAISAVIAWRAAPTRQQAETLVGLFALNGFLNVLWSLIFFRMQRPDWAAWEVLLLWLSIAALIGYCGRFSKAAAALLVPYILWVTLAATLNWQVVALNGPFG